MRQLCTICFSFVGSVFFLKNSFRLLLYDDWIFIKPFYISLWTAFLYCLIITSFFEFKIPSAQNKLEKNKTRKNGMKENEMYYALASQPNDRHLLLFIFTQIIDCFDWKNKIGFNYSSIHHMRQSIQRINFCFCFTQNLTLTVLTSDCKYADSLFEAMMGSVMSILVQHRKSILWYSNRVLYESNMCCVCIAQVCVFTENKKKTCKTIDATDWHTHRLQA